MKLNYSWLTLFFLSFLWASLFYIYEKPHLGFAVFMLVAAFFFSFWQTWWQKKAKLIPAVRDAALECGLIVLVQGALMPFYYIIAVRVHSETIFAKLVEWLLSFLGIHAVAEGNTLIFESFRKTFILFSNPEKVGSLYLLLFLVGGYILLLSRKAPIKKYPLLLFLTLGYAWIRYGFLILLSSNYYIHSMFWERTITLVSWFPYAFIAAWVFRHLSDPHWQRYWQLSNRRSTVFAASLGFCLAFLGVAFFGWHDYGQLKDGRILVDEYHSDWEWTTEAYDTTWFGERSGYNYYCFFDYMDKFYQVDRNLGEITPERLANFDIFIMKTPTLPFAASEIDAMVQFVENGGGLYLIGDHTNVFGTGSNLNEIARHFGLNYHYDCTYELTEGSLSEYKAPKLLPHPAISGLPHFLFATSCTLDASWRAEEIMIGYGLKNFPADYSQRNFFPVDTNGENIEFGLFLQSAGVAYGQGRVLAFTDSTVFSNFWMYMPGKPQLLRLSLHWLNHTNSFIRVTPREIAFYAMLLLAVFSLTAAIVKREQFSPAAFISGGLSAVVIAVLLFGTLNRAAGKLPEPIKPMTNIVFDLEYSQMKLPMNLDGFLSNMDEQLNTFYVWTQRLGYYPSVKTTFAEALATGDLAILAKPKEELRSTDQILDTIRQGSKLLILDNTINGAHSNPLLRLVGLEIVDGAGNMAQYAEIENIPLTDRASSVQGGTPIIIDDQGRTILSVQKVGEGLIAVFSDPDLLYSFEMGDISANLNDKTSILTNVEFKMIKALVEDY